MEQTLDNVKIHDPDKHPHPSNITTENSKPKKAVSAHNLRNLRLFPTVPSLPNLLTFLFPLPFSSKQAHVKYKRKMKVFFRNKRQIPDPDGQALLTLLNRRNSVA